jgi:dolichyl-phosphate beta-glucosyltransferase
MTEPYLSIVIPAYDEEQRLPRTLERLAAWLRAWGRPHEVLVVDDGSRDGTVAAARAAGAAVLANDRNRGKGYSVRRGMLAARGALRLMTDADLSTPIEELPRLVARIEEGCGVAIGSRALPGARIEIRQPWYRENMGRVFNLMVRGLALPGLRDTQCGFKLFTAEAARDAFADARLDGFSFDVEALYLARKRGHRVCEIPVVWRNDAASRVTLSSGLRAFLDLARIRANDLRGRYDDAGRTEAAEITESTETKALSREP